MIRVVPFLLLALIGCGPARASVNASVTELVSPAAGIRCFAIVDGDGKVAGGSCLGGQ